MSFGHISSLVCSVLIYYFGFEFELVALVLHLNALDLLLNVIYCNYGMCIFIASWI